MTTDCRPEAAGRAGLRVWALATTMAVVAVAGASLAVMFGCANRTPAAAENREVRLTTDEAAKLCPRYSHDNAWIAYAARGGAGEDVYSTYVIPPAGGQPRQISPDSLSVLPLAWSADDRGVYCRETETMGLYFVGLDGSARPLRKGHPLTRLLAVTDDGRTELMMRFNRDNRDVGIRREGGKLEFLAETPTWEEGATFGPGPDEVTVVSSPSYLAPVSSICVWSPATRAYAPLPLPEGRKFEPAWAPDGGMLAYVVSSGGQSDIWTYDPATTRATPLVDDPRDATSPAWSPDGDRLAFVGGTRTAHLFAGRPGAPGRRQLTDGPAFDSAPVVSPDGKWIAFVRRSPGGAGSSGAPGLCVMPVAGGEVRELDLKGVALPASGGALVAWSRDSRQLAFNGSEGSAKMDVFRIGPDGEGLARVTVEPGEEVEPSWSPDGRFVLFTQAGGGALEVAIVPAHGGLPRVVTPKGEKCEGGVWAPGSDRVAYVSYRADGGFEIWVTSIAEPEQRSRLFKSEAMVWPVFWTDDGKELVVLRSQGRTWIVQAVALAGGAATEVGRGIHLPSGKDMVYEFLPGAERYEKLFYPGGVIIVDGKDSFDLYVVRVRDRLASRPASAPARRFPWPGHLALAGCL